jgi:DNA repair protein RecO (recombination protein O)
MHHIYHTEGIILGSKNYGEAGKYYYIFTRDLGLVYASASGVRKMSSKLRFILHDFAYVKIDLVQGKDFWRVTSASKTGVLENLIKKGEHLVIFSNIARLLKRLLAGIEKNEPLFLAVLDGLLLLEKSASSEESKSIEINIVLTILDKLGYVEAGLAKTRAEAINIINQALKETHL